jgi:hypothetical protein
MARNPSYKTMPLRRRSPSLVEAWPEYYGKGLLLPLQRMFSPESAWKVPFFCRNALFATGTLEEAEEG